MRKTFLLVASVVCFGWLSPAMANDARLELTTEQQHNFNLPATVQKACEASDINLSDCIHHAWACREAEDQTACAIGSINSWVSSCTTNGKDDGSCSRGCAQETPKICPAKHDDSPEPEMLAEELPAEPAPIVEPQPAVVPETVPESGERIVCPGNSCSEGSSAGIVLRSPGPQPFRVQSPVRRYYPLGFKVIIHSTVPKW